MRSHPLHAGLRGLVTSCVGYDYRLDPDAHHYGVPSTGVTLIVAFDEPLDCSWLDGTSHDDFGVLVAGLHSSPALIRTHGHQAGIQLSLTPQGARALLGVPAAGIADTMLQADAQQLVPGWLRPRLQESGWDERFRLLEAALLSRMRAVDGPRPEVAQAWRLILASGGRRTVESIADEVGYSRRRLLTTFRAEYGLSPKGVARLARFEHARRLATAGLPLAEVAASAGYVDQSHLTREWRGFAGRPPRRSDEVFPIVQDGDATP